MIRITENTTIAQLALFRAALGVEHIAFDYDYSCQLVRPVRVALFSERIRTIGTGDTEAEAFDDAFSRMWHRQAMEVAGAA